MNYTELSISFPIHEQLNYKSFDYEAYQHNIIQNIFYMV